MSEDVDKDSVKKDEKKDLEIVKLFTPVYYSKYRVHESVIIDDTSYFLSYSPNKGFVATSNIPSGDIQFCPVSKHDIPYKPYTFSEMPNLKIMRPYTEIYKDIYREFNTFVVSSPVYKHIFTSFTSLGYRQALFDCLTYLFLLGLTNSGKSTVLRLIAYLGFRPMYGVSFPSADIFTFLGKAQGGDNLILEDEVQGLERDREKLKIYKSGNLKGAKVPRMLEKSRKILWYNTFGLKGFGAEKRVKDEGFMRRSIIVRMVRAKPKKKLTKATEEDKQRFSELRNQLLLWRLVEPLDMAPLGIPETGLNDLWEPILCLARGTDGYPPLIKMFGDRSIRAFYLDQQTLEGYIAKSLRQTTEGLTPEKGKFFLPFEVVWGTLMELLNAELIRPYTMYSDELGEITKQKVGGILRDIFAGDVKTKRSGEKKIPKKGYVFDKEFINEVFDRYESVTDVTELLIEGGVVKEVTSEKTKETVLPTHPKVSNSVTQLRPNDVIVKWIDRVSLHGHEEISSKIVQDRLLKLCNGNKAEAQKVWRKLVKQNRASYHEVTKTITFHPSDPLDKIFDEYETE